MMQVVAAFAIAILSCVLLACGSGDAEAERRIPAPGTFVFTAGVDLWIQDEHGARLLIEAGQDQQLLQPAISPDGAQVAYVVFQLTQAEGTTIGTDLAVSSIAEPQQRIVVQHQDLAEFFWNPRWTPDGESLIVTHESAAAPISVVRVELPGGDLETLRADARDADISPDGARLVFVSGPYSGDPHLVVRSLADGSEIVLDPARRWQPRPFRIPRFSADGESVIFSAGQYLPQVSARPVPVPEPGPARSTRDAFRPSPVPAPEPGPARAAASIRLNGPEDLWSVHLPTGELRQLAAVSEDQPDFTLSADGRHVLIFGAFGTYLISTSALEPAYAIAPGEFHGWIDWIGNVSDEQWAEIRESVFEIPDRTE